MTYVCYMCLSLNMKKLIPTQQVFMNLYAGDLYWRMFKNYKLYWNLVDIAGVLHALFFILEKLHKKVLENIETCCTF